MTLENTQAVQAVDADASPSVLSDPDALRARIAELEAIVGKRARRKKRRPDDFYETPQWCTQEVLHRLPDGAVFDPCAGTGAILRACILAGRYAHGVELDAGRASSPVPGVGSRLSQGDGLAALEADHPLIVMNPPYATAEAWVRAAVRPGRVVAVLLRLGFLASTSRKALFLDVGTPDVHVLTRRPSFTGGTDCTDYGWFVWGLSEGGRWCRIEVAK
jgi:hypothetical protein